MRLIYILIFLITFTPFSFAKKKTTLNLAAENISDVSKLKIPRRIKKLILSGNQISSLEGLVLPEKLKSINLARNNISTLEGLNTNSNLIELFISDNPISDYSELNNYKQIKSLSINSSGLNKNNFDFNYLTENLEILSIALNFFTELDLKFLDKLKELNMKGMFSSTQGGTSFDLDYSKVILPDSLEELLIGSEYVDDFTNLQIPNNVTNLCISSAGLTVAELFTLKLPPNLKKLRLKRNKLTTLDGIEFPDSLRVLNLQLNNFSKEEKKKIKKRFGKKVKVIFKCKGSCKSSF